MNIQQDLIIGELVAQDYRAASVFKEFNIDFCCQGNRSIKDACEEGRVDPHAIIKELERVLESKEITGTDYQSWPLDLLADYVEKRHHRYVEIKTKEITPYLEKIVRVHGERHPELAEIEQLFKATTQELAVHMKKEELMLFPVIRKMVKVKNEGGSFTPPATGTVENRINSMMQEHETEGERFRKIDELSHHYVPPHDACNTYRVTLALLNEFEQDLHLHIHLENNILFPKAILLEKKLYESQTEHRH